MPFFLNRDRQRQSNFTKVRLCVANHLQFTKLYACETITNLNSTSTKLHNNYQYKVFFPNERSGRLENLWFFRLTIF